MRVEVVGNTAESSRGLATSSLLEEELASLRTRNQYRVLQYFDKCLTTSANNRLEIHIELNERQVHGIKEHGLNFRGNHKIHAVSFTLKYGWQAVTMLVRQNSNYSFTVVVVHLE
ncbi:hypothetical protein M0802_000061 [Mischocyttarus mexicanus]|nr:hypothetical protein M0802_000061 [Mischocyttarus mexicanus]